jgi:hypothetical protein
MGADFCLLLCPDCIHLSPMLMGTGEVVPLGAVKHVSISVHSLASTLINDYLYDVASPSVVRSEISRRAHHDQILI